MTPTPARDTPAGRADNDLRNLAKRQGRDPAELFTLYALEGFLGRLAASAYADDFVLKGGVLMAAFAARRPTRDIDLAASGFGNDIAEVERRVREMIAEPLDDGVMFHTASVAGEHIRDEADYTGVRVKLTAGLGSARIALHVDVNFGDPIWPAPTTAEIPRLFGGTLEVNGYPDHMVVAEKLVTAVDRGEANTRWRDFVDVAAIAKTRSISASALREAMRIVARHRGVTLEALGVQLGHMPEIAQVKWATWRRKQRLTESTPSDFAELLDACVAFADPVIIDLTFDGVWNPAARAWEGSARP